jgi:biotin carboxyl carrier protein
MKRTIRFRFEGRDYTVEVERSGDLLSVSRGEEHYTVQLLPEQDAGETAGAAEAAAAAGAPVPAAPMAHAPSPGPSRGKPAARAAGAAAPSACTLLAPMTGLVKEIRVKVGSDVKKGQVVLVMEAMKMDVEVSCPATGVVAEIPVKAGDSVETQQPLMIIQ